MNRLCIIEVHSWSEIQGRNNPGQHVEYSDRRMTDHEMSAALRAKLTVAHTIGGFVENADEFRPCRYFHCLGPPTCPRMDWITRPRTARGAMAIAHTFGFSRKLESHSATKARALIYCTHIYSQIERHTDGLPTIQYSLCEGPWSALNIGLPAACPVPGLQSRTGEPHNEVGEQSDQQRDFDVFCSR